jgi:hypothetical protein
VIASELAPAGRITIWQPAQARPGT